MADLDSRLPAVRRRSRRQPSRCRCRSRTDRSPRSRPPVSVVPPPKPAGRWWPPSTPPPRPPEHKPPPRVRSIAEALRRRARNAGRRASGRRCRQPRPASAASARAPLPAPRRCRQRFGARDGAERLAAAAAADAGQRLAMGHQRRRRLGHERRSAPQSAPRGTPAQRGGAARADAVPRMETVRVTQPDLQRRGALEKTRSRLVYTAFGFGLLFLAVIGKLADATILQPLAPHRAEGRSRRCSPRRKRDGGGVARAARDDHRPQWPDPGDLAAHRRGVRRSAPDHRPGRCGASAEAGAAAAGRGRGAGASVRYRTGSSSIWNARSRRASNSPSIRSASPGSISARPSSGTIRWAAPPRRCWAAPMSTSTASPGWRSTSTSGCSATPRRCGCRSTCACRRWCATNCPRRSTSSRRSAAAAS